MFDRATRLWAMSPTSATVRPAIRPLAPPDRQGVEQRLGGMLVRTVAGVHDPAGELAGEHRRHAMVGVAYDDEIGEHRGDVVRRVAQGLPLRLRRTGGAEVDHVRREPLGGDLEGDAGAGRRLEEEIHHRLAAQGRHLLDRPAGDFGERLGGRQDELDLRQRELRDPQQILATPGDRLGSRGRSEGRSAGRPLA